MSQREPGPPDATVTWTLPVHDGLMRLRVLRDDGSPVWRAGQYIGLGLDGGRLRRPLSISSPILDDAGRGLRAADDPRIELYVRTDDGPFGAAVGRLQPGDRVWLAATAAGDCTLDRVPENADVLMLATGAGEAPHNALVEALLRRPRRGRVVSVACCRYRRDLAYAPVHGELMRRYPDYRWIGLTTREGPLAGRHLQDLLADGSLWRDAELDPSSGLHVFLCGHPAMVGRPREEDGRRVYPAAPGVVGLLDRTWGLTPDEPDRPGQVHFERYG